LRVTASSAPIAVVELPHDPLVERYLVSAIVANPALLADDRVHELAAIDLHDRAALEVMGVVRNLEAAGHAVTREVVVAEIERQAVMDTGHSTGHKHHPELDELLAIAVATPPARQAVHRMIERVQQLAVERDRIRTEIFAQVRDEERLDAEIDEVALRDVDERPPTLPISSVPVNGKHVAPPKQRWIVPLESFLGDEEPSDDDAEDWIIRDIVPRGEPALFAGPPKCGKTWSMISIAIAAALGKPWLETFENTLGRPARVLGLAFEDGQRRLRKRVWELARALGVTPNDPTLRAHLSVGREPLSIPGDERAFAAELKAWRPDIVLIDNLTRVMVGDQNAIKDVKRFCDAWCKLGGDVGASVMFLHHTSKVGAIKPDQRGAGDPFELVRGSGDIVATARHIVLTRPLESPDDDTLADVRMRGNLDLRREDFVMSFARVQRGDRHVALLADRGDGEKVRGELADKRRADAEARKQGRRGASGIGSSVDDRVFNIIVGMHSGGARDLCTVEQIRSAGGVRRADVSPAVERLIHAGRITAESTRRDEGGRVRTRSILVPVQPTSTHGQEGS
jgi:hypothetical protein